VLAAVCIAWIILFLLFAPFLLIAEILRLLKREHTGIDAPSASLVTSTQENNLPLHFDRRTDVSKLSGCNTRNVRYRWTLFESHLQLLQRKSANLTALDFGAGSLRDSYELATRGFKVISFDLNERVLRRYFESYGWSKDATPTLMTGSLGDLISNNKPESLQLVIAFDVIEHLEDPASYVKALNSLLSKDGYLFTIVPNKRSLFERYFKYSLAQSIKRGASWEPGVPHIQFKSPEEWDEFFKESGFKIIEHDMAIGFFVNDWNGLLGLPLRVYVTPVLVRLAQMLRINFDQVAFEERFSPPWLMKRVHVLDQMCKKQLASRFGWNLIVATK